MDAELVTNAAGVPEFTELGKRIEMRRIERGLSKQDLARLGGTSRQQLWRVMTGKSELTGSLRERLADALRVSGADLRADAPATFTTTNAVAAEMVRRPASIEAYVTDRRSIERTLASMPGGVRGRSLKKRVLDAIEDVAIDAGCSLGVEFFDIRRRVLSGDL